MYPWVCFGIELARARAQARARASSIWQNRALLDQVVQKCSFEHFWTVFTPKPLKPGLSVVTFGSRTRKIGTQRVPISRVLVRTTSTNPPKGGFLDVGMGAVGTAGATPLGSLSGPAS